MQIFLPAQRSAFGVGGSHLFDYYGHRQHWFFTSHS
jgi:hypothetical protein